MSSEDSPFLSDTVAVILIWSVGSSCLWRQGALDKGHLVTVFFQAEVFCSVTGI